MVCMQYDAMQLSVMRDSGSCINVFDLCFMCKDYIYINWTSG